MNKEPLVSVVIPTIPSRKKELKRAVLSVMNQSYRNIIIHVIVEGKNAPESRNIGIDKSKGKYIAFLDDDDEWHKDKILEQVKIMEALPHVELVTTYHKDHRNNITRINKPLKYTNQMDIINNFNYSSTSTYMIRTPTHFDESLVSAQEYDLAIRLTKEWYSYCIPKVLVTQHGTPNQISTNWKGKRVGLKQVYKKHKKLFNTYSKWNRFKFLGIYSLYLIAPIFGCRIYKLINKVRK